MERTLIVALDSHDVVQDILIEGKDASDLAGSPDIHYIAFTEGEFPEVPVTVSFEAAEHEQIRVTVTVEFSGEEISALVPPSIPAANALETAQELTHHLLR
jgi:hypothetical protein